MQRFPTTFALGVAIGFNAIVGAQLALKAADLPIRLVSEEVASVYLPTLFSHTGWVAAAAAVAHALLTVLFVCALGCVHSSGPRTRWGGENVALLGFSLMAVELAVSGLSTGTYASTAAPLGILLLACIAVVFDRLVDVEDDPEDEEAFTEASVLGRGLAMHALMYPQLDELALREERRS